MTRALLGSGKVKRQEPEGCRPDEEQKWSGTHSAAHDGISIKIVIVLVGTAPGARPPHPLYRVGIGLDHLVDDARPLAISRLNLFVGKPCQGERAKQLVEFFLPEGAEGKRLPLSTEPSAFPRSPPALGVPFLADGGESRSLLL